MRISNRRGRPRREALSSSLGEGEGAILELVGSSGVFLVQQRSDAGDFREPKRRGMIAVFEGGKDRHALGRREKSARKKKSID